MVQEGKKKTKRLQSSCQPGPEATAPATPQPCSCVTLCPSHHHSPSRNSTGERKKKLEWDVSQGTTAGRQIKRGRIEKGGISRELSEKDLIRQEEGSSGAWDLSLTPFPPNLPQPLHPSLLVPNGYPMRHSLPRT